MSLVTCQEWDVRFLVSLRMAALGLLARQPGSGYDLLRRVREVDGQRLARDPEPALRRAQQARRRRADRGHQYRATRPQGIPHHPGRARGTAALGDEPRERPPVSGRALLRVFLLGAIAPEQARKHMVAVGGAGRVGGEATRGDARLHRLDRRRQPVLRPRGTGVRPSPLRDGSGVGPLGRRGTRPPQTASRD